jgi:hypothetical protein
LLRRLLPPAAVMLVLAFMAAPSAHALPARDIAGVAVHPWRLGDSDVRERTFAGIAATGARWVRVDLRWNLIERNGPSLHNGQAKWTEMDAIVSAADRHGLLLLPILGFTPHWASDHGELWGFPDPEPFERFFDAALRRYPQIPAWEVWNEPNFGRFAKPHPDAAGFVALLRSARRVRDSVGSSAKLIAGGLAPVADVDIDTWLNQVAIRGGLQLVDGLGIHPYSVAEPDDPRAWMMQLERLHQRVAQLGRPDLPLWLTEYGAPAMPVSNGYGPALTEQQQADRLRRAFALATRFPWVENLTWYEYRDSCDDAADAECRFGLVRSDLSPRPAYDALREVVGGATTKLRSRLVLSSQIQPSRAAMARASRNARAARRGHAGRRASKLRAEKWTLSRRPTPNRITVSGRLTLPGQPAPSAVITVLLPRRGAPPRPVTVVVTGGFFRASFDGSKLRSGTVEARYAGDPSYEPIAITARMRVTSAAGRIGG